LKDTNLEAHFLLLAFFDKINFSTTLLLKLGQIFDEVAKLGKSTQDAYNPGKWLILLALLKIGLPKVSLPTLMTLTGHCRFNLSRNTTKSFKPSFDASFG